MISRLLKWPLLAALLFCSTASAVLTTDRMPGGAMEVVIGDKTVQLPLLKTDMVTHIRGDTASVELTQTFKNPTSKPINARYVFPLPPDAAIHAMRFYTGDFIVEGEIHEVQEAKAIYAKAKKQGKQAALTVQHRPNVFTQDVANLMPGATVKVELHYVHGVPKVDGKYEFTFPMIVGPRYVPAAGPAPGEPAATAASQWDLAASAPVAPPAEIDQDRVSIKLDLESGMPIYELISPTHHIVTASLGPDHTEVRLATNRTVDNKDFVLRYRLGGPSIAAGVTTFAQGGHGVVNVLVEPPLQVEETELTQREIVFVLDCSGSMEGTPLDVSKRFMRRALKSLRSSDLFRVIRFSDSSTEFADEPLPGTPANIASGLEYIESLTSEGGTEMTAGIHAALDRELVPGTTRIVVFLTDGYIGNDVDVIRLVNQTRGDARLFTFGIGSAVNDYLLKEVARVGRGVCRIVRPQEDAEAAADALAKRLEAPYLTDVRLDWGNAPILDQTPAQLQDLYLGQSLRVLARFQSAGTYSAKLVGRIAGREFTMPLVLDFPADSTTGDALPIIWARGQIEDRMIDYLDPGRTEADRAQLQREIMALGLEHHLVTPWTSFVAVSRRVVNPAGNAKDAEVAVPQVDGVDKEAYPAQAFFGKAAPEPAEWAAILLLGLMSAFWLRRNGREGESVRLRVQ